MIDFNYQRAQKLALGLGAIGVLLTFLLADAKSAAAFVVGAAFSLVSIHSWVTIAGMLGEEGKRPTAASVLLMVMRYVLIGVAIYVIVKVLGTSPAAMIGGLLVAFGAVFLEVLYEFTAPKH